jgi:hypothetical protein
MFACGGILRFIVMAGEGRPSTSFLHAPAKVVDGRATPDYDDCRPSSGKSR